jgi:hypothetical protein
VQTDFYLHPSTAPADLWQKMPVRYFQCASNSQTETEVPNVKNISIDRSIDSDSATCTISIYNQNMDPNDSGQELELGSPGYFTWSRGTNPVANTRWGHEANAWQNVLTPNALLRTYQGFGGTTKTIEDARADGNIVLTGVWLVDEVRVQTNGEIELRCRDMAKLLIEQKLYPPLVPSASYPLDYRRIYEYYTVVLAGAGERPMTFSLSGNQPWYGGQGCYGRAPHQHCPTHVLDENNESYWLSVGNDRDTSPWAFEYIEFDVGGGPIDTVSIWAKAGGSGGYQCFISIMEDGVWQGPGMIDSSVYAPMHIGRYGPENGAQWAAWEANIPYVMQAGVPYDSSTDITLPRIYNAQKIRLGFTNLWASGVGNYQFRAAIRRVRVRLQKDVTEQRKRFIKNFDDFADIVKELLLWSGWWLCETTDAGLPCKTGGNAYPQVFGNIECTGVPGNDLEVEGAQFEYVLPKEMVDKVPVIDAINALKEIVGYLFYVDEDGAARFQSPNWWQSGNFDEFGQHTNFIPDIDERVQLTDYALSYSDQAQQSEIIVSSYEPTLNLSDTITHRIVPPNAQLLKGMVKVWPWINGHFGGAATNGEAGASAEQAKQEIRILAELVTLHMWFRQRVGMVQCVANPAIQIDDQVRIYERQSGETYIHYVRGINTNHDLDAGTYTMNLTTHWMGTADHWAITRDNMTGLFSNVS